MLRNRLCVCVFRLFHLSSSWITHTGVVTSSRVYGLVMSPPKTRQASQSATSLVVLLRLLLCLRRSSKLLLPQQMLRRTICRYGTRGHHHHHHHHQDHRRPPNMQQKQQEQQQQQWTLRTRPANTSSKSTSPPRSHHPPDAASPAFETLGRHPRTRLPNRSPRSSTTISSVLLVWAVDQGRRSATVPSGQEVLDKKEVLSSRAAAAMALAEERVLRRAGTTTETRCCPAKRRDVRPLYLISWRTDACRRHNSTPGRKGEREAYTAATTAVPAAAADLLRDQQLLQGRQTKSPCHTTTTIAHSLRLESAVSTNSLARVTTQLLSATAAVATATEDRR